MAEGILRARAADTSLDLTVSSAGIFEGGAPATETAVAVCADRGVDISGHVSRRLDRSMIDDADLILAMTREHLREAVVADPSAFGRTFTLRELVRGIRANPSATLEELHEGRELADYVRADAEDDVPDPVRQPRRVYEQTVRELDILLAGVLAWLLRREAAEFGRAAS